MRYCKITIVSCKKSTSHLFLFLFPALICLESLMSSCLCWFAWIQKDFSSSKEVMHLEQAYLNLLLCNRSTCSNNLSQRLKCCTQKLHLYLPFTAGLGDKTANVALPLLLLLTLLPCGLVLVL